MEHVGIRELKAKLSEYLHRVRNGETLAVTDRGKSVARLTPSTDYPDLSGYQGWSTVRDPGTKSPVTLATRAHPGTKAKQKSYATLLKETKKAWGYTTSKETLTKALEEHLRYKKQLSIIDLAGTIDFHPGYDPKEGRRKR